MKKDAEPESESRIISPGQSTVVVQNINLPSTSQEWQSHSEPTTPSTKNLLTLTSSGSSTNLLAVPQPSYLVKQHSHPLLPSQQQSTSGHQHWMPRQHSNPEYPGRESTTDPIPLIKIEEGQSEGKSTRDNTTTSSGLRIVPPEFLRSSSTPQVGKKLKNVFIFLFFDYFFSLQGFVFLLEQNIILLLSFFSR